MSIYRTICTSVAAASLIVGFAYAAPQQTNPTKRTTLRIGSPNDAGASYRGGGFAMCGTDTQLVSENWDMSTVTPGNSINCFSGSGTPEHSYGRSHDLSLGSTAGLPLEISCIHFVMAQNSVAGFATVNVYIDLDGSAGPTPDGGDLWPLGSVDVSIPATSTPTVISASLAIPLPLAPDSLVFIEIVIPESYPGTHEIGSNAGGELSPSWLKTTNGECGIGMWVNPAALGFADMHIVEAIEVAEATIPDPCDSPLPECATDVDGDGIVAVSDVLAIIGSWGSCGDGTFRPTGDIAPLPNGDCCVDVADILAVIGSWGYECQPGGIEGLGINEIRIDHSGTDDNEYIELIGDPGDFGHSLKFKMSY